MGNTWACYRTFQAGAFDPFFFAFPRTATEERWRQMLARASSVPPAEYSGLEADDEGEVALDSLEGGRAILAHGFALHGSEQLAESDIIHDLWCDFPPVGAPGSPARAAFDAFLGLLGYLNSPSVLPWWVSKAYPPGDHYTGLASPAQLADFAKLAGHAGLREALRAAILRRWGKEQPRFDRVLDFIERAAASSRWLLAIESAC